MGSEERGIGSNLFECFKRALFSWGKANTLTVNGLGITLSSTAEENGIVHFNCAFVSLNLKQLGILNGIDNLELNDGELIEKVQNTHSDKLYQQAWENINLNLLVKSTLGKWGLKDRLPSLSYNADAGKLSAPYSFFTA